MRLLEALRLGKGARLALVGAGGKTTALFQLGRQLSTLASTVFLSTTTHLATDQLAFADRHFVIADPKDVEGVGLPPPPGILLFTGAPAGDDRVGGVGKAELELLKGLADHCHIPFLVEADGSRRLPLKAPAAYEPDIPPWAEQVVVLAGLSGLGKPLSHEWVHRPERFAALTGLELGQTITKEALLMVLRSLSGGLQGLPAGAKPVALLNQADTSELQAAGSWLARKLLPTYKAALVATLGGLPGIEESGSSPKSLEISGESGQVITVHEPVAGIILAAGSASRMGQVKQVMPWKGRPLVEHVARVALEAELSPLIVVTGFAEDQVRQALKGLEVEICRNPDWQEGQGSSVAAGAQALPAEIGAAVFLLADQPQIPSQLVSGLVDLHAASLAPIVAPMVEGQRGNPVLFDRLTFDALRSLHGEMGGRALFSRFPVTWLPWLDGSISLDVDKIEDFLRLQELGEN